MTEKEKSSSFEAVRRFLISREPKYIHGANVRCLFIEEDSSNEIEITISQIEHIPT